MLHLLTVCGAVRTVCPTFKCRRYLQNFRYSRVVRRDHAGRCRAGRRPGAGLDEAGLTGSYARIDGVEATRRYKDGQRYLFLLNHGDREVRVATDRTGTELITGSQVEAGAKLVLPATGVVVLRSDDV